MIDLKSILEDNGFYLYDQEIVNENGDNIYRVYITSKNGICLDDCVKVSKIISPLLDLNPPIKSKYTLEVSSPGIERILSKKRHFAGSIGERVRVKLTNADMIEGILKEFENDSITIAKDNNTSVRISLHEIKRAKTYFEW